MAKARSFSRLHAALAPGCRPALAVHDSLLRAFPILPGRLEPPPSRHTAWGSRTPRPEEET